MLLRRTLPRTAAVLPLVAILSVFLLAMVAFSVDMGYVVTTHMELEAAADAAALAGTARLLDRSQLKGTVSWATLTDNARSEAIRLAGLNRAGGVSLALDRNASNDSAGDIVCGYLSVPNDPTATLDTSPTVYNSVQVRTRRSANRNGSLGLFFAPALGIRSMDVETSATATYEGAITAFKLPNSSVTVSLLPFALDIDSWTKVVNGIGPDQFSYDPKTHKVTAGSDGVKEINLYPEKGISPGNFGTVDIGALNNSTADIERQIRYGISKADLDLMGGEIRIPKGGFLQLQGDTGISAGFKDALASIIGQPRVIPIYRPPVTASGNNSVFNIIVFAGITITQVQLTGMRKQVTIQPEFVIDPNAIGGGDPSTSYFVVRPLRLTR